MADSDLSDVVDLAERAARLTLERFFLDGNGLIVGSDGGFWKYTGTHWQRLTDNRLGNHIWDVIVDTGMNDGTVKASQLANDTVGLMRKMQAKADDPLGLEREVKSIINCQNGELWIGEDGSVDLKQHSPDSYQTHCIACDYDPDAEAPLFEDTVAEIFSKNDEPAEMSRHMLEVMGYILQPKRFLAAVFMLQGRGRDGKTKLIQTLSELMSIDAVYACEIGAMGKDANSRGPLAGRYMLLDDDVKTGTVIDDGMLKKISEGKLMSGSMKYGQEFSFLYRAAPVLIFNNSPKLADISDGMRRRLNILPFKRKFSDTEDDPLVFERIWHDELSGVLNHILGGMQRVLQRKCFSAPDECGEAAHNLLIASNPLPAFLDANQGEFNDHLNDGVKWVQLDRIKLAFSIWCRNEGIPYRVTSQHLRQNLENLGYQVKERNVGLVVFLPDAVLDSNCTAGDVNPSDYAGHGNTVVSNEPGMQTIGQLLTSLEIAKQCYLLPRNLRAYKCELTWKAYRIHRKMKEFEDKVKEIFIQSLDAAAVALGDYSDLERKTTMSGLAVGVGRD